MLARGISHRISPGISPVLVFVLHGESRDPVAQLDGSNRKQFLISNGVSLLFLNLRDFLKVFESKSSHFSFQNSTSPTLIWPLCPAERRKMIFFI